MSIWKLRACAVKSWPCLAAALFGIASLSGCQKRAPTSEQTVYVTEYGLGPDKWATAWLLTKHPASNAKLHIGKIDSAPARAVSFDLPSSAIRRIGNRSSFEVARTSLTKGDETLDLLTRIVHEIEINYWTQSGPPEARVVENAFRALQLRYGRDAVSPPCYVAFFNRVYQTLQETQRRSIPFVPERLQLSCEELESVADRSRDLIPETPVVDVLSAAAAGRKVIFVDVREADEYLEGHIPGALNIPIRDVSPALRSQLSGADYVVSYCVKDFRGFEMAKALAQLGVENSVIMRPYGIKGWVALGLPVTGDKALTEAKAAQALDRCIADVEQCLSQTDGGPI